MRRADAERLVEDFKRQAVEVLVEDAYHSPIVMALAPGGNVVFSLAGVPGPQMWPMARVALAQVQAYGYVCAVEAWAAKVRPDEIERVAGGDEPGKAVLRRKPDSPRPSQHPDRREVLMVQWQFKLPDGEWDGCWQQEFDREGATAPGEGGTIVLGQANDLDAEGATTTGRGVRLLDPEGPDPEALPPHFPIDKS